MQAKIDLVYNIGSEFSDGAFFALCEENGVDATDLEAYFENHEEKKKPEPGESGVKK